jgi:stage V sporulation protein SpoVS
MLWKSGAPAVHVDDEAAEASRLGGGALDLREHALAVERGSTAEKRLDVPVVEEAAKKVEVAGLRPPN